MENKTVAEQKIEVQTIVKLDFVDSLKCLCGRTLKITTTCLIPQEQSIDRFNSYAKTEIVRTESYFIKQNKPNFGYSPKNQ